MKMLKISESEVHDVFSNGEYGTSTDGSKLATKKYRGYEIGLFYKMMTNGQYMIIAVWKRERR